MDRGTHLYGRTGSQLLFNQGGKYSEDPMAVVPELAPEPGSRQALTQNLVETQGCVHWVSCSSRGWGQVQPEEGGATVSLCALPEDWVVTRGTHTDPWLRAGLF